MNTLEKNFKNLNLYLNIWIFYYMLRDFITSLDAYVCTMNIYFCEAEKYIIIVFIAMCLLS